MKAIIRNDAEAALLLLLKHKIKGKTHYVATVVKKRKGPRTKAPFTSHHPLPPKRSFNDKLLNTKFTCQLINHFYPIHARLTQTTHLQV